MKLEKVLRKVYHQPWLIKPEVHRTVAEILIGGSTGKADVAALSAMFPGEEGVVPAISDRTMVIPVYGIISSGLSELEKLIGMTDCRDIEEMMREAMENDEVDSFILDINSPGGTVTGVPELADFIAKVNTQKPVYSWVDELCCSAAYWLASSSECICVRPSAVIGSIGVYMPIYDNAKEVMDMGISPDVITSGARKGIGVQGVQITYGQKKILAERVDELFAMFKQAVMDGRDGELDEEHMDGRDYLGAVALDVGMVDEVCDDMDEVKTDVRKFVSTMKGKR